MKKVIYVGNLNIARGADFTEVQHLYFGNEFCENLIPDKDEILALLEYVRVNNLALTILTPYCTDYGIKKLQLILSLLPAKTEVVFNDWGVFEIIKKHDLIPILGRLLITIKRDVRIDILDKENSDYFKTSNLNNKDFQDYLIKNNIFRVELDNVTQGYGFKLNKKIKTSLHYPFVYVSTSRKCITSYAVDKKRPNCFPYGVCNFECVQYAFSASLAHAKHKLILKGNSIFYKNEEIEKNIKELAIDRLIFYPELPFSRKKDKI